MTGGTGEREHARELCLLGSDVFVAGRLDVPLGQTTLALEDTDDIGEIGSGLLGLLGGTGTSSDGSRRLAFPPRSTTGAPAIVELIPVPSISAWRTVISVASWSTSITVPLSLAATVATSVPVLSFPLPVITAGGVGIYVVVSAGRAVARRARASARSLSVCIAVALAGTVIARGFLVQVSMGA